LVIISSWEPEQPNWKKRTVKNGKELKRIEELEKKDGKEQKQINELKLEVEKLKGGQHD